MNVAVDPRGLGVLRSNFWLQHAAACLSSSDSSGGNDRDSTRGGGENDNTATSAADFNNTPDSSNTADDIPPEPYVLVGVRHLVGVMLCIYVKTSLVGAIRDIRWATNSVGVMGVMGNKGGVTCRWA